MDHTIPHFTIATNELASIFDYPKSIHHRSSRSYRNWESLPTRRDCIIYYWYWE